MTNKCSQPNLICEIGVNHEGSLDLAINMIEQIGTAANNPHVRLTAKFQAYKASKLASQNSPAYWDLSKESTKSQYELFKKYDLFNVEDYQRLKKCCDTHSVEFLITAFDIDTLRELDPLVKRHKIASADLLNVPLLRSISSLGKPILLSTGAATKSEIDFALDTLISESPLSLTDISLLHCVLNYPTPDSNAALLKIQQLRHYFPNIDIGYSDHTVPDSSFKVLFAAMVLGVTTIEKHYTYDKSLLGNDHYHAIDSGDLNSLINLFSFTRSILGESEFDDRSVEHSAISHARRSIVTSADILKGDTLTEFNLTTKRPGTGISSMFWDDVIGKIASSDIPYDTILSSSHYE